MLKRTYICDYCYMYNLQYLQVVNQNCLSFDVKWMGFVSVNHKSDVFCHFDMAPIKTVRKYQNFFSGQFMFEQTIG